MLFMPEPDIDGALVGGASLTAESFVSMVRTAGDFAE
jgi:triosephosphate isomerase